MINNSLLTGNEWTINGSYNNSLECTPELVITGVVLIVIVLITICGNILVLLAISTDKHLRSPTYCFMAALAIADLLLGTTVLPFSSVKELLNYWPFGSVLCDIWLATDVFCCTASIYLVLAISIDRYIGVTRPLKYNIIITKRRAYLMIIFVWIISLLVSVVPFLGWKKKSSPGVCEVNDTVNYAIFSASISFYIPLVIILIVYWRIYKEACKQSRFLQTGVKMSKSKSNENEIVLRVHVGNSNNAFKAQLRKFSLTKSEGKNLIKKNGIQSRNSLGSNIDKQITQSTNSIAISGNQAKFQREKKAAKTLAIVVGCFILCWMPFFVLLPIVSFCKSCNIPELVFKFFFWLGYCNSMMNPMIYAFSSMEIRKAYKKLFKCCLSNNNQKMLHQTQSHLNKNSSIAN